MKTSACFLIALALAVAANAQSACPGAWTSELVPHDVVGSIYAVIEFDDGHGPRIFVGGAFGMAGAVPAANIAAWDGQGWSTLGPGVDGAVRALAVHDDGSGPALFAAGSFMTAGGIACSRVAKWNGRVWQPLGSGMDADVDSLVPHDDGSGPRLFAGGAFTTAGGIPSNHCARWDGDFWTPLGSGIAAPVTAMARHQAAGAPARLYAAATIPTPIPPFQWYLAEVRVFQWDGSSWSPLGSALAFDISKSVRALVSFHDGQVQKLFAAGTLDGPLGVSSSALYSWSGTGWQIAAAVTWGTLTSLAAHAAAPGAPPSLYVGGDFELAGQRQSFARWTSASLVPAAPGFNRGVTGLASVAVVGGPQLVLITKRMAGLAGPDVLASWTGGAPLRFPPAMPVPDRPVRCLRVLDIGGGPELYAGGVFGAFGIQAANGVARFDGTAWHPLGNGISHPAGASVQALAPFDDGAGAALYAAGQFSQAGSNPAINVAKWNGAAWSPLGAGIDALLYALETFDDGSGSRLYAGGIPIGSSTSTVWRWTGSAWATAGALQPQTYCLAVFTQGTTTRLYAGGANGVWGWNGLFWQGHGLAGAVIRDLAVHDDGSGPALYACGGPFSLSGIPGTVVRWNGTTWSPVGTLSTSSGTIGHALAVLDLGAGPRLVVANGSDLLMTSSLFAWSGSSWSALTAAANGPIDALAPSVPATPGSFFAGGSFSQVGTKPASNLARWGPAGPIFQVEPSSVFLDASAPLTLSASVQSGAPVSWTWRKNGIPVASATGPVLSVAVTSAADAGSYDVTAADACGSTRSASAQVSIAMPRLAWGQPLGAQSLALTNTLGRPGSAAFTAITASSLNWSAPGNGPWAGLHIGIPELIAQFATQASPFVSVLGGSGSSIVTQQFPGSLSGMSLAAVTVVYDPSSLTLIAATPVARITVP